jgi:hypothetical protein
VHLVRIYSVSFDNIVYEAYAASRYLSSFLRIVFSGCDCICLHTGWAPDLADNIGRQRHALTYAKLETIFEDSQTLLNMDAVLDSAISNIEDTAAHRDRYADWRDQVRSLIVCVYAIWSCGNILI